METERDTARIRIEVAYARPDKQSILTITVAPGTTVAEAIEQSAIRKEFPEIQAEPVAVGIFSRKVAMDHVLREGDRIEIYRPLIADPKEARRQRAKQNQRK
jgi:putative ubiquitin-RnfH superfamily antitoxin RatB of RatAB toxin-antitoxin module